MGDHVGEQETRGAGQRLEERERELEERERQLEERERQLSDCERRGQSHERPTPPLAEPDPFILWKQAHRKELEGYRGQHVAINPEKGIIAAADDYATLDELLDQQGVPDNEVIIDFISPMYSSQ